MEKAQKGQVSIIFLWIFWLKKERISHSQKDKNKIFSVINKHHISSTFWLKNTIFSSSKKFKTITFESSVNMIFKAKKHITSLFFCFFYVEVELKHPPPHFLGYPSFVNTMERSSIYQLAALKNIFFCSQKSITSIFPLS